MLLEGQIKRLFLQFLFTSFEMRLDRVVRPQASALPPFCPKHLVQSQFSLSVLSDLGDSMDCSTPGFTVHHQLSELTQTHVLRVGDAIQPSPSYPLSSPSPPCLQSFPASGSFQMSQFLTSGGQSIGVSASTSVLPKNIQD